MLIEVIDVDFLFRHQVRYARKVETAILNIRNVYIHIRTKTSDSKKVLILL